MTDNILHEKHRKRQVRHRGITPSHPPASTYHAVYDFRPCEAGGCMQLHTGGDDGQSRFCTECSAERGRQ